MPASSLSAAVRRLVPGTAPLLAALALLGIAASAPVARAQITAIQDVDSLDWEEEDFPTFLYGFYVFGAINTMDMQQLNEALVVVNSEIAAQGSFGVQFDPVDRGGGYGAGLQLIVKEHYVFRSDWERILASTHVGGVTSESRVEVPADAYTTTLGYDVLSSRNARFGFGVGFAYYKSKAEQVITETLTGQDEEELGRVKLDGSTVGPVYQAFFEAKFTDRLFVGVTGGYRQAKVSSLDISGLDEIKDPLSDTAFISIPVAEHNAVDDAKLQLRDGGDSVDWSGFYGRFSLTYYINVPTF